MNKLYGFLELLFQISSYIIIAFFVFGMFDAVKDYGIFGFIVCMVVILFVASALILVEIDYIENDDYYDDDDDDE